MNNRTAMTANSTANMIVQKGSINETNYDVMCEENI